MLGRSMIQWEWGNTPELCCQPLRLKKLEKEKGKEKVKEMKNGGKS